VGYEDCGLAVDVDSHGFNLPGLSCGAAQDEMGEQIVVITTICSMAQEAERIQSGVLEFESSRSG
jgi:hypothetical protein